ncbi:MAG: hypothetical protein RL483_120 [Pseudomonadota bacterium]
MAGVKNLAPTARPSLVQALQQGLDQTTAARLAESLALAQRVRSCLARLGQERLAQLVVGAHRSDPARGVRGSQLTIVAQQHSAAAKLKLVAKEVLEALQSEGLGFQSVSVRAQRLVTAGPRPVKGPRPSVPATARARLMAAVGLGSTEAGPDR